MIVTSVLGVSALALLSPSSSRNTSEDATAIVAQDENGIRAMITAQTEAWNRGDAKAYSKFFHEDGSFTNIMGTTSFGRQGFESRHEELFATIYKGSNLKLTIKRLKFLRPDVALADIEAKLDGYSKLPPGIRTEPDGILRTRLQQVLIYENGMWGIAAFHNVDLKPLPPR